MPSPDRPQPAEWRDLSAESLREWIAVRLEELPAEDAIRALRHPFCSSELIEAIAEQPRLLAFYEVAREIARHPRAPLVLGQRLVAILFWRDLLEVALDTRIHPRLRRSAEGRLVERLSTLSLGERVSLARRASPALQAQLRRDPDPRVIRALLENSRLTEGSLLPLLASAQARPEVLAVVAADQRWGARYEVRRALVRNPRTPVDTAVGLVALLRRADQRSAAGDTRLHPAVRQRAALLSGG